LNLKAPIVTALFACIGVSAIAADAPAATAPAFKQYGAALTTPGFEDVAILDSATFAIVTGADDSQAAGFINTAGKNAMWAPSQLGANKSKPSLTERIFAAHFPPPLPITQTPEDLKAIELNNLLLHRKLDVIGAKRYLLVLPMNPFKDDAGNQQGSALPRRDSMGRYALRFQTGQAHYYRNDDGQVVFQDCVSLILDIVGLSEKWTSIRNNSPKTLCLSVPEWTGLNMPAGILFSDMSKLGNLGLPGEHNNSANRAPDASLIRAGVILTASSRSGVARDLSGSMAGREFSAQSIIVWDEGTMQVLAGPIDISGGKTSPDLIYATDNCTLVSNGLNPLPDPAGNCKSLNPTLSSGGALFKYVARD